MAHQIYIKKGKGRKTPESTAMEPESDRGVSHEVPRPTTPWPY